MCLIPATTATVLTSRLAREADREPNFLVGYLFLFYSRAAKIKYLRSASSSHLCAVVADFSRRHFQLHYFSDHTQKKFSVD